MDAVEFRNAFQIANVFSELQGWSYIGDDHYERYVLGEKEANPLICFGINPSTAKPRR